MILKFLSAACTNSGEYGMSADLGLQFAQALLSQYFGLYWYVTKSKSGYISKSYWTTQFVISSAPAILPC